MTRQAFLDFIHAAEHSSSLREAISSCTDKQKLLNLASNYGFSVSLRDIEEDSTAEKALCWFDASKIAPIRRQAR